MSRFLGAVCVAVLVAGLVGPSRAGGDKDAQAILDKGIKALGGADKLASLKSFTWKGKGKISIGGSDNAFTLQGTAQGLDHLRSEFEGEFDGNKIKGVTVLAGDKGWRKFGDMDMEMDKDAVANEKRNAYLLVVPVKLLPLKGKGFTIKTAAEEKVAGKAAVGLQITGPDGKDFKLYFDKKSGLPVKLVAKVVGFMGEEALQETTFSKYKDFGGIRRATHAEIRRDGERFIEQDLTEFRALPKVDPKTFTQPQ